LQIANDRLPLFAISFHDDCIDHIHGTSLQILVLLRHYARITHGYLFIRCILTEQLFAESPLSSSFFSQTITDTMGQPTSCKNVLPTYRAHLLALASYQQRHENPPEPRLFAFTWRECAFLNFNLLAVLTTSIPKWGRTRERNFSVLVAPGLPKERVTKFLVDRSILVHLPIKMCFLSGFHCVLVHLHIRLMPEDPC
jgi:hypothetical protein